MSRRAATSAPGKLILMGEHAAVYGRLAVVAALGMRTTVEIEENPRRDIELDLKTLQHRELTDRAAIEAYTAANAERWRRYEERPTTESFGALADRDPGRVVKLALGEAARALGSPLPEGLTVRVASRLPVGSGFGSSASVAVAVASALLALAGELAAGGEEDEWPRLASIAREVERRQHGRPSGVDHTTVLRGGILGIEPGGAIRSVQAGPGPMARLRIFDSGRPAETTGEVVAAVRDLESRDPAAFAVILDEMESATRSFADALGHEGEASEMLAPVKSYQRRLEEIGVVPAAVSAAVREVEKTGSAAKLSGAGSLSGRGGGAILVCRSPAASRDPETVLSEYPRYDAEIGAAGLRVEESV